MDNYEANLRGHIELKKNAIDVNMEALHDELFRKAHPDMAYVKERVSKLERLWRELKSKEWYLDAYLADKEFWKL